MFRTPGGGQPRVVRAGRRLVAVCSRVAGQPRGNSPRTPSTPAPRGCPSRSRPPWASWRTRWAASTEPPPRVCSGSRRATPRSIASSRWATPATPRRSPSGSASARSRADATRPATPSTRPLRRAGLRPRHENVRVDVRVEGRPAARVRKPSPERWGAGGPRRSLGGQRRRGGLRGRGRRRRPRRRADRRPRRPRLRPSGAGAARAGHLLVAPGLRRPGTPSSPVSLRRRGTRRHPRHARPLRLEALGPDAAAKREEVRRRLAPGARPLPRLGRTLKPPAAIARDRASGISRPPTARAAPTLLLAALLPACTDDRRPRATIDGRCSAAGRGPRRGGAPTRAADAALDRALQLHCRCRRLGRRRDGGGGASGPAPRRRSSTCRWARCSARVHRAGSATAAGHTSSTSATRHYSAGFVPSVRLRTTAAREGRRALGRRGDGGDPEGRARVGRRPPRWTSPRRSSRRSRSKGDPRHQPQPLGLGPPHVERVLIARPRVRLAPRAGDAPQARRRARRRRAPRAHGPAASASPTAQLRPDEPRLRDRRDDNDDLPRPQPQGSRPLRRPRRPDGQRAHRGAPGVRRARTVLGDDNNLADPDAPGAVEWLVEESFDRRVVVVHLQGAAGDVSPAGSGGINCDGHRTCYDFARRDGGAVRGGADPAACGRAGAAMTDRVAMEMVTRAVPLGPDWRTFTVRSGALPRALRWHARVRRARVRRGEHRVADRRVQRAPRRGPPRRPGALGDPRGGADARARTRCSPYRLVLARRGGGAPSGPLFQLQIPRCRGATRTMVIGAPHQRAHVHHDAGRARDAAGRPDPRGLARGAG